jgi:hypothetical protein
MFLLESRKKIFVLRVLGLSTMLVLLLIGATASNAIAAGSERNQPDAFLPDPVVDGRFYDASGNILEPYSLLYTDPAIGNFYTYLSGSTLYVAVVEDPDTSNDNVFDNGTPPAIPPSSYMSSVGWNVNRSARLLRDSEALIDVSISCGESSYTWTQTYVCGAPPPYSEGGIFRGPLQAIQDAGFSFEPDGVGAYQACGSSTGVFPPSYNAATSLAWNYNNTDWEPDQSGAVLLSTGDLSTQWKSPFGAADTPNEFNYPYFNDTHNWEWSLIYEMGFDVSICAGEPMTFSVGDTHDSPDKDRLQDPPIIPTILADYGDLPNTYDTLLASNGARHAIVIGGAYLGAVVDVDFDGQPSPDAISDDFDIAEDDEDGVVFLPGLSGLGWTPGNVTDSKGGALELVINGGSGIPQVFVDFNANGVFDDNPATGVVLVDNSGTPIAFPLSGTHVVYFDVPANAFPNSANAIGVRVRLSNAGGLTHNGAAPDGEVEDYIFNLSPTALQLSEVSLVSGDMTQLVVLILALGILVATVYAYRLNRKETNLND